MIDAFTSWVEAVRPRRLPHRHGEARRARRSGRYFTAGVRDAPRPAEQARLPHVRRGLRRRRRAPRQLHGARRARQRLLLLAALPGVPRRLRDGARPDSQKGTQQIAEPVGRDAGPTTTRRRRTTASACRRTKLLVDFLDNHDVRALPLRRAGRHARAPQRADAAPDRGRHPVHLLRHRAGLLGRQRSGQPRGLLEHELRRDRRRRSSTSRSSKIRKRSTSRSAAAIANVRLSPRSTSRTRPTRASSRSSAAAATRPGSWLVVVITPTHKTEERRHREDERRAEQHPRRRARTRTPRTYTVAADGSITVDVDAQRSMILVPQ